MLNNKYLQLAFVIAFVLRLLLLFSNKLLVDPETANWYLVEISSFRDLISGNYFDFTFHGFLYLLFLKIWAIFSIEPVWLRIPSLIFSLIQIPLAYKIVRKIFNRQTALLSVIILATSAYHLFWSVQVRSYAMLMAFQLIYIWLFLKSLETEDLKDWLLSGLFGRSE